MPLIIGLSAAGAGLLKSELVDAPKAERQRKLAAATQRYSPWTHLQAQPVQEADPFGSALQFGATGAAMGANYQNMQAQNKLMDNMGNAYGAAATNMQTDNQLAQMNAMQGPTMPSSSTPSSTGPSLGVDTSMSAASAPATGMSTGTQAGVNPWDLPLGDPRRVGMGYYGVPKEYWPQGSA